MEFPHNKNYEDLLLGSCLNSFNAANECLFSLEPSDFLHEQNKTILGHLKQFYKETACLDLRLFIEHLKKHEALEKCGGSQNIWDLNCLGVVSYNYETYLEEIKNLSSLRKVILSSQSAIEQSVKKDANYADVSKELFKNLFSIDSQGNTKTHSSKDLIDEYSDHGSFEQHTAWMRERIAQGLTPYTGIASHYPILDKTLGFFRNGAIYYIGARTSMGKTTFMLNLIISMMSRGESIPTGIFSLEMPANLILAKILCLMSDVAFSAYEDGTIKPEQYERLMERASYARKLPIFIEDEEDMTISKLRARARRLVHNEGAKIIFIDYLTRIKSDTKYPTKHLQVDEISKGLQSMAKELNVPVICLAQLNRESENKPGSVPTLSSFRESGSIEEDCDGAILLHRPDYYNPNDQPGKLIVHVAKNRIRGRLKKIEFGKALLSERFEELPEINEELKKAHAQHYQGSMDDFEKRLGG